MAKDVTIYVTPTCPHCFTAMDYLTSKGVEFTKKDIQTDQTARLELMQKGVMAVPAIQIGEELIVGFDKGRVDQLLGL